MNRGPRNEAGKLFIGGLSWDTDQDSLLNYFSQYGEVVDCVVMKNQQTGKSRGFGFVTFSDAQCVDTVLSASPHDIDGRQVDAKACNPKAANKGPREGGGGGRGGGGSDPGKDKKIFMGGLPNVDADFLRNFFGKYGKVLDVNIMVDQQNKKSRGFGFLSFESEEAVERVCAEHFININGKQVECKRAEPRDGRDNKQQGFPGRQNMGGPPPPQDAGWNQGGGNWNQGPPQHGPPPPGPPMGNNMGFPPQGPGGYQPPGQGFPQQGPPPQAPPQQPPFTQPNYQGSYQTPPGYQQGAWNGQPPNVSPGQQGPWPAQPAAAPPQAVPPPSDAQSYSAYAPAQTAYSQPPTTSYSQWGATPTSPVAPQPAPTQPPAQQPSQPSYSAYGQPPTAAPATPGYAPAPAAAPAVQPYASHYNVAVADPSQPAAPAAAQSAYAGYNPYAAPQNPSVPVADPYAQVAQPATVPGAQVPMGVPDPYAQQQVAQPTAAPGYGAVPPVSAAPPTDPAAAQAKPPDYSGYSYGTYGYGDQAGFGVAPQPAAAYAGQGDGQPAAYAAQPGGGYQRASVPSSQAYHPYRR